ncbi:CRF-like Diuretic Hormone Receptor 1, partial [Frankliniella occidentalis]
MTLPDGRTEGVGGAAAAGVDSGPPGGSAEARLLGAAGASWPPINDSLLGLGADGSYTSPESELCALTTASTPLEGHDPHCPASWDLILCWPPTRPGALAVQQCLEELNGIKYDPTGNASRWCFPNGTWSRTNYSLCKDVVVSGPELEAAEAGAVEFVTMVYQVGYGLSLVALAFAVLIFVSFKDLHCLRNSIHTNLMFAYIMADLTWILNNSVQ